MTTLVQTSPSRFMVMPSRRREVQAITAKPDADPPHLSYSQVKRFSQCPLQWYLSRRYPPAFVPAALVFGSSFHSAVEAYYQARLEGRTVGADDLLAAFDAHWRRETDEKKLPVKFTASVEDAAGMRELAGRMLAAFVEQAQPGTVVALEEAFGIELAPDLPPVVGKIDMIEVREDADGVRRAWLVDVKTAARKPSADDIDADQLLLYALAAKQVGWVQSLGLPLALRFDYITKVKAPQCISLPVTPSTRDTTRFVEKVRQCHRAMRAGIQFPSPGWQCSGCGHAHLCAAWPQLPAEQQAA